jgi:hypothetical protein
MVNIDIFRYLLSKTNARDRKSSSWACLQGSTSTALSFPQRLARTRKSCLQIFRAPLLRTFFPPLFLYEVARAQQLKIAPEIEDRPTGKLHLRVYLLNPPVPVTPIHITGGRAV